MSGGDAWRWVESSVVFAIHDRQLAEHGGMDGVRDPGMVESALAKVARAANLARYGSPDAADLAAAYAFGIAKNHGFLDGNKRTAWVTARLFLADNDRRLEFDPIDAIRTMEAAAAGRIGETELANWFRSHLVLDENPPGGGADRGRYGFPRRQGGPGHAALRGCLDVFPGLPLLLTIMSLLGRGMLQIIVVLGISGGIPASRVTRSAVIDVKDTSRITPTSGRGGDRLLELADPHPPRAAQHRGSGDHHLHRQHRWRDHRRGFAELLGFGLPPDVPSWGGMLSRGGRQYMEMAPRFALWPGLCLTIVVYSLNMFGDAVRDLLDPRLRGGGRLGADAGAAGTVVECKVLHRRHGLEPTIAHGLEQTARYMDRCGSRVGHLVIFDPSADKNWDEKVYRREESLGARSIVVWGM